MNPTNLSLIILAFVVLVLLLFLFLQARLSVEQNKQASSVLRDLQVSATTSMSDQASRMYSLLLNQTQTMLEQFNEQLSSQSDQLLSQQEQLVNRLLSKDAMTVQMLDASLVARKTLSETSSTGDEDQFYDAVDGMQDVTELVTPTQVREDYKDAFGATPVVE